MDIAVAGRLAPAADHVTDRLSKADIAFDTYVVALGSLWAAGGIAAEISGIPSCLLSPAAQGHVAEAITLAARLQAVHTEIHRALHGDKERLAPDDDQQKAGGGGGKLPPKP